MPILTSRRQTIAATLRSNFGLSGRQDLMTIEDALLTLFARTLLSCAEAGSDRVKAQFSLFAICGCANIPTAPPAVRRAERHVLPMKRFVREQEKSLSSGLLICIRVFLTWVALALNGGNTATLAYGAAPHSHQPAYAMQNVAETVAQTCAKRLDSFVQELDELLASNPNTIYSVLKLLDRSFPVHSCNIPEAITICRQSKFFDHISKAQEYYVVVFNSRGFVAGRPGFLVQFSLVKASGDLRFPYARINDQL